MELSDLVGDMEAEFAGPESRGPGPELTRVRLRVDPQNFEVAFEGAESIDELLADSEEGSVWFLRIWSPTDEDASRRYLVAIGRESLLRNGDGSDDLVVAVCPQHDRCDQVIAEAKLEVADRVVTAEFPRSMLGELGVPFDWAAQSFRMSKEGKKHLRWSDFVPDRSKDGVMVWTRFPSGEMGEGAANES